MKLNSFLFFSFKLRFFSSFRLLVTRWTEVESDLEKMKRIIWWWVCSYLSLLFELLYNE